MKFANATNLEKRPTSELLILPFWKDKKKKVDPALAIGDLKKQIQGPIDSGDFTGDNGEMTLLYPEGKKEKRLLLVGLGEKDDLTVEELRRISGKVVKLCHQHKVKKACFALPKSAGLGPEDIVEGITEGALSANYVFEKHKKNSKKQQPTVLLENLTLVGATPKAFQSTERFADIAEGVNLTRDLINGNADDITPQYLASVAKQIGKKSKKLKVTVLDKKAIAKEKMGLIQAVSRGGPHDPVLIVMEYKGNPKSKECTAIVGKGITFDTGGLNLKPTGSMETMKSDMSGGATILGTMHAIAKLGLKTNVVAVVPATENSISDRSYKPGDIYTSYAGITVEIGNTDAEGRLVLADALAYAVKKYKPARIVDLATLTGAIVIALGSESAGLMSSNDALADSLLRSGSRTHERLWRMPIFKEYREQLDSKVADISNVGGREGGSITAALFLKEFVGDTPWAHIDIAGTAFLKKSKRYMPQHASGFGVRLLMDFISNVK